ncbi:MAG: hypothetical protein HRT61_15695 [Ekhidna sp.]|nr:hypothetical protein [Ekhidna sp.]
MGSLKDREVQSPTFTFQNPSNVISVSSRKGWNAYLAVAASVALLMIAGYLTGFNLTTTNGDLQVSFDSSSESFTQDEVKKMIADAINQHDQHIDERLSVSANSVKQYIDNQADQIESQLVRSVSDGGFEQEKEEYLSLLKQMLENSELAQKKYTDQVLTDFAIFLDIQRQNDLNVIQTRFDNLRDDAELNLMQTNQLLSNLMYENENANQY